MSPRVDPIQESFIAGEISPRLLGRTSLDLYKAGLSKCENFLVYPHGGVTKRGGFRYVAEVKDSTKTTILQKFDYKDEFQYVFEFGHKYIRIFRDQAAVMSEGLPYEIVTTYTQTEVKDLRFTQDEEKLFIVHKDHLPAELIRVDHDDWTLQNINFSDKGVATVDTFIGFPVTLGWTERVSPADNNWTSICWSPELDLFCAVANSGASSRAMTSPDGTTWTYRTSSVDNNWTSICWSPELTLFVAVANSGASNRVMTSPDGINWTTRATPPTAISWNSVCWSPELTLYVAVGPNNINYGVMTSPNGINWTLRVCPVQFWSSVCWSSELALFVTVSNNASAPKIITSSDGISWTQRTPAAALQWQSVCWSSELTLFVAVASTGANNRVMTSSDGVNWITRIPANNNNWVSVCWSPELGLFCAVSSNGTDNRVMTSPNGIDWAIGESAVNNSWTSVCGSPELVMLCAVASSGTADRVMTYSALSFSGTYTDLELTGGSGNGAIATVVVINNVVDSITIVVGGGNYEIDDILDIPCDSIAGLVSATCEVATLTTEDIPSEWGVADYPTLIWFFEQRLWFAATPNKPNKIWGSKSANYFNLHTGTGLDDEGIAVSIKSATKLLWAVDGGIAIMLGAHNGEFTLASNGINEALTPSNIRPVQVTGYGSTFIPTVQISADILFVQRGLRKIRRLQYDYMTKSHTAMAINVISEHITESGIIDVAYSNEPNSIYWAIRTDGILIAMTYDPDNKVFGWHRHVIGGVDTKVQSITNIDGATDISKDELWAVIERTINGSTVKYIEFLVPEGLSLEDDLEDAFFVESGVTKTGSGFTIFDGLDHLEGEEVRILADGAIQAPKIVSDGEITLDIAADIAHAGLMYNASIETLPLEGGNPIGTAQTKIKRISKIALRMYKSLTFYIGDVFGNEDVYPFGPPEEMGSAIPLFTGDIEEQAFPGGHDIQGKIRIASYDPVPLTILAIMYELRVKD